jgi:hypothetical protein
MQKLIIIGFLLIIQLVNSQEEDFYRVRTIAFYNVENLFDINNDTLVFDDERTPSGRYRWTLKRYQKKIRDIASVLSEIGITERHGPPDIIGLCEVENLSVLKDLVRHPKLYDSEYGIVHYDSPDERGIDVALLYRKQTFLPISIKKHRLVILNNDRQRDYSRDQLVVSGLLSSELVYLIINHWPSRSGGQLRSQPHRVKAAELNKHIIDSISKISPSPRIISLGDFNDNPTDYSMKMVLELKTAKAFVGDSVLYNPMGTMYQKGIGTLAYRDQWSLFDQIYMSGNLIENNAVLKFWKAGVFNPSYLITQQGPYKGYPLRTYSGGRYTGGYSDHFPVYALFIQKYNTLFGHD